VTQAELVAQMQERGIRYMNTSTLSRIEAGTRPVRLTEAQVIGRIFQVSVDSMTSDFEEIALYESRARSARLRYMTFRDSVVMVTRSQLALEEYLPRLHEIRDSGIDKSLRDAVEHTIRNIEGYLQIDVAEEAAALRDETRAEEKPADTPAGRFLKARRRRAVYSPGSPFIFNMREDADDGEPEATP